MPPHHCPDMRSVTVDGRYWMTYFAIDEIDVQQRLFEKISGYLRCMLVFQCVYMGQADIQFLYCPQRRPCRRLPVDVAQRKLQAKCMLYLRPARR